MAGKHVFVVATAIICLFVLSIVIGIAHVGIRRHRRAVYWENVYRHANLVLARAGAFKPGMSEDEIVKIVGIENWSHVNSGGTDDPASEFYLGPHKVLVIKWRFEEVPNDTTNRSMYIGAGQTQRMVKIYKSYEVNDVPR